MGSSDGSHLSLEGILKSGLEPGEAGKVFAALQRAVRSKDDRSASQVWSVVSKHILQPDQPFALHQLCYRLVYESRANGRKDFAPVWSPSPEGLSDTNLARYMDSFRGPEAWQQRTGCPTADLALLHSVSCSHPELFWPPVLKSLRIRFHNPPFRILQDSSDPDDVRWLPGARLNIAECALSSRDQDALAVLWADESAPSMLHTIMLGQLRHTCMRVAAAVRRAQLPPGAAIAIAMPMTVEAVYAYLGIVLAGCSVVGVADSFAPGQIQDRLRISQAQAIVTQDVILRGSKTLPMYERVLAAHAPKAIVVPAQPARGLQVRLRPDDVAWPDFLASGEAAEPVAVHVADSEEVSNILFSSGTTGEPKAIPWTHTTPIRCAVDAWSVGDVQPRDVLAWPTNLGWMMGPWLLYAALLNGATMALFHGSPLGRPFGEFVQAARVSFLGVVPSLVKTWRSGSCMQGLDWGAIRRFASTGEASSPDDSHWLSARAGYKPILEYIGGTEIGGSFLAGSMLQPQIPSTFSTPTLGTQVVLLTGEEGSQKQSKHGSKEAVTGELALMAPCLGWSQRLLNRDHHAAYYEGMPNAAGTSKPLRRHGDEMERLPNGYYVAHGRADDTMNLGGIKVSSVEIERACVESIAAVIEAAAVGVPAPGGGPDQLVLFVVLQPGTNSGSSTAQLQKECQAAIRQHLNPLFRLQRVVVRDSLPRTASNKVMRRLLRDELKGPASRL